MVVDMSKPIECIVLKTGRKYKIDSINFPLGSPSGKDLTIMAEPGIYEWYSINEVQIISNIERG